MLIIGWIALQLTGEGQVWKLTAWLSSDVTSLIWIEIIRKLWELCHSDHLDQNPYLDQVHHHCLQLVQEMKTPTFINLNLVPTPQDLDTCHLGWSRNSSEAIPILSVLTTIWIHPVVQEAPLDTPVTMGPLIGWTGVLCWRGSTGRRLGRWPRRSIGGAREIVVSKLHCN